MSDLQKLIGQLLIVGFEGPKPSQEIVTLIRDYHVGNIILFQRNCFDPQQILDLTQSLQKIAKDAGHKHPLFISIDQENGIVSKIPPPMAPQFPGAMTLGAINSSDAVYNCYQATSEYLRFYGIQYNYAPVGDVNNNPNNPVIGVRSYSDNPYRVAEFVKAAVKGHRAGKVATSVKHFPGHGDTSVDSHHNTALINKDLEALEKCELIPFKNSVDDSDSIMMAHVIIPALGDDLPCSVSPSAVKYLKENINYKGLVITDCLTMNAVSVPFGVGKGAVMSVKAGVDCPMICHHFNLQVEGITSIEKAVQEGTICRTQLEASLDKLYRLKEKLLNWQDALEVRKFSQLKKVRENTEFTKSLYAKSTTLIRKQISVMPFKKNDTIAYVIPTNPGEHAFSGVINLRQATRYIPPAFAVALQSRGVNLITCGYESGDSVNKHDEEIYKADRILVISRGAHLQTFQKDVVRHISNLGKPLAVIATDIPYDFLSSTDKDIAPTYICTYEPTLEAFEAALDVLFGNQAGTSGVCPVKFN